MNESEFAWDDFADDLDFVAEEAANSTGHYMQWLPPQKAFLSDPSKKKLFRAGNQSYGKTTAALWEVFCRCIGEHPYLNVKKPPVEAWIICVSWSQSLSIQMKFWNLIDKKYISKSQRPPHWKNGFGDKNPTILFENGSIVRFKTQNQDVLNLSSATIDVVFIDEPVSQRMYSELSKRVMKKNGVILIGMTPINAPEPLDWLQGLVESGVISETWYPLEAKYLIPDGQEEPLTLDDGTPMDDAWIARIRAETLAHEEPVVVDGEWETRVQGRLFKAFIRQKHAKDIYPQGDFKICIGIDYGAAEREFAQCIVLCAVDDSQDDYEPFVYVIDEWSGDGTTTTKTVAEQILLMLERHKIEWKQVDFAFGDIPAISKFVNKSNLDTMKAIARKLEMSPDKLFPRILSAKTKIKQGSSMVRDGCQFLHQLMVYDKFNISPKCERLIKAMEEWDYSSTHPLKDVIDALRYSLKHYIYLKNRKRFHSEVRIAI